MVFRKYCWRTSTDTWRSAFLLRFCLLRLKPTMAQQALAVIHEYAHRNNEWLESDSLYQNLSIYDLVDEFNGLVFSDLQSPLTRLFSWAKYQTTRLPEAVKFWIMVRTGTYKLSVDGHR